MREHYCHNCLYFGQLADGVYCGSCLNFYAAHSRLPRYGEELPQLTTIQRLWQELGL